MKDIASMKDKVVFITGGSDGYGKAAAKLFTENGATVVIAARTEHRLKSAQAETGCADYFIMDVTDPVSWENARNFIIEKYKRIDVLINNAGGAVAVKSISNTSVEEINKIIGLNLTGTIYGAHAFADTMKSQGGGTIINVSSVCAKHSWPGWSVYTAAKAGVLAFSKNLYVDLQHYNIRVTCIVPGAGATDFMLHAGGQNLRTKLKAEDVAEAMLAVCSLPQHAVVEELTLWGSDQVVIPL